jgi:hypothetical protein
MDQVLRTPPPPVDVATAPAVAAATFGVEADSAIDLGSERDRAFLLHGVGTLGVARRRVNQGCGKLPD